MDSARPSNPIDFLNLNQAAQRLAVTVDVLRSWNEHNILKPTITPTGEVGYTQTQIDHFLAIRKIADQESRNAIYQEKINQQTPSNNYPIEFAAKKSSDENSGQQQTNNFSQQINNYHFYNQPSTRPVKEENKLTFSFLGIVATFSLLGIVSFVVLFSNQSKFNSLNKGGIAYDSTNSTLNQTSSVGGDSKSGNLKNEGYSVSNNNSNINKAFETKTGSLSSRNSKDQATLLKAILGKGNDESIREGVKAEEDVVTYGQTANFGTSSNCPTCTKRADAQSTVFDTDGNIKVSKSDPSENDLLATTLGVNSFSPAQNLVRQNSSSAALFTFLILALLALYALYSNTTRRKFAAIAPIRADGALLQPISFAPAPEKERIIEVGQKTDGTVVVSFQGKEYKISKPELDSESDKFIERLMQLSTGIKEIEYDCLEDEAFVFSTPLSKIVTRLGFVGVKRDLFFPRTSKTRVLFRKYITLEDLFAMNMTIDQLSDGFIRNNWL